jgi:hypothetical protein
VNFGERAHSLRFDMHIGRVEGSYVAITLEINPDHRSVEAANMPGATGYHRELP